VILKNWRNIFFTRRRPKACNATFQFNKLYKPEADYMRAIQVVGFSSTGKTTLVEILAEAMEKRGLSVSIAKHVHHGLDKEDVDTSRLMRPGRKVLGLGIGENMLFEGRSRDLRDFLPALRADVLLVEGWKKLSFLPRIICIKEPGEFAALCPELAIGLWGAAADGISQLLPAFNRTTLEDLVDSILARGFCLPGLDCNACRRGGCSGLAAQIVAGAAKPTDCIAAHNVLELRINGQPVALNHFAARFLAGGLRGMLEQLKDFYPGDIELRMKA
jgi:molybdopterin-guanine dinucleotide biosynthesis protein B